MKTLRPDSKAARTSRFYDHMAALGFTYAETEVLRLAEKTLHRWAERECNGEIERDEKTGKIHPYNTRTGERCRYTVPDKETGALKRIAAAVARRNDRDRDSLAGPAGSPVIFYHQTDPRGAALYLVKRSEVPAGLSPADEARWIESNYSRGFAVCI